MQLEKIPIIETFISFQGEGRTIGVQYYFIRVAGCPLRCNFCDTERSWKADADSIKLTTNIVSEAITKCKQYGIQWVSITGGEPLLYPAQLIYMIEEFHKHEIKVHIETSGRYHNETVHFLCDLYSVDAKTPCTGESRDFFFVGMKNIRHSDQVKCLIHDKKDLAYAYECNKILDDICPMVLQPFNIDVETNSTVNMNEEMKRLKVGADSSRGNLRITLLNAYEKLYRDWIDTCEIDGWTWKNVIISPQLHVLTFGNIPMT